MSDFPALLKSIRPSAHRVFGHGPSCRMDIGPTWWCDGRMMIDASTIRGCKGISDRMLNIPNAAVLTGRMALKEQLVKPSQPACLLGYEPTMPVGYVANHLGRIMCFEKNLLNVFMRTGGSVIMNDKCIISAHPFNIVGLLMSIACPVSDQDLPAIRSFFNGHGAYQV